MDLRIGRLYSHLKDGGIYIYLGVEGRGFFHWHLWLRDGRVTRMFMVMDDLGRPLPVYMELIS